ncbi:uncharacterized protein K452DRAFT_100540 [Aplosporella prunicola CBS 121167]|uniref:Extracellular membrane protein CFEM domain-containing protein n=1 Tax=Aplosporella prunicola CBS 121167 TaxID=1176127 RepID=A0A6A6B0F6_9PEZI|nr:uncharacterized protein K452DRAFT_100540 [Aplosporella prunicola CBS 121167]KAF2137662.1 hypothetical protein K452DRAFT_100540 [Aplosporella prunicola CBS 121167]
MKSFIILAVVQLALAAPQLIPNASFDCQCNIPACPADEPQRCLCENQAALECWEYQSIGGQNCPSPTPRVCTSAGNSTALPPPKPTPSCECEQKFCLQSWPGSCYCANQNKLDCYYKCGGTYPELQSCPTLNSRPPPSSVVPSPDVPTFPVNSTPTTPLGLLPSNPLTVPTPDNSGNAYPCNIIDLGYDPCAGVGNYHCLAYEAEIECKPSGCGVYCTNDQNPMTMIIDLFFPVVTSSSSSSSNDGINTEYTTSTSTAISIRTSLASASFLAPEALTPAPASVLVAEPTTETLPTSTPPVFPTPDTLIPNAALPNAFRSPYRHSWVAPPVLPFETPDAPVQTPDVAVQMPDTSEFSQDSSEVSAEPTDSMDMEW